jgi:hypothetical protein
MAFYLVRAQPRAAKLPELEERLRAQAFVDLEPFARHIRRHAEQQQSGNSPDSCADIAEAFHTMRLVRPAATHELVSAARRSAADVKYGSAPTDGDVKPR